MAATNILSDWPAGIGNALGMVERGERLTCRERVRVGVRERVVARLSRGIAQGGAQEGNMGRFIACNLFESEASK